MIKPKVYHYSVSANTPHTFSFDVGCSTFLVKNIGTDILNVSYGTEIDNDSYIKVMPKTAEIIFSTAYTTPDAETTTITVSSASNCDVEIRLLEF